MSGGLGSSGGRGGGGGRWSRGGEGGLGRMRARLRGDELIIWSCLGMYNGGRMLML